MLKLDFNERADSIPQWLQSVEINTAKLWKYPNRKKVEGLIADQLNAKSDNVFLSNGGDESIELLFKLCKLKNQSVLVPMPAFSQYTHQLKVWEIDHTIVDCREDLSININSIKKNLKTNQWLVLTRPNNPTGECIAQSTLRELINYVKSINAFVFLDEAYIEFYCENNDSNYALEYEHVVSLRTFSKAYGLAGARLGYLLGNKDLINQFKRIAMPFNVNTISLQLATMALKNSTEMKNYCKKIAQNRQVVFDFLQSCAIEVLDGKGNFLLLKIKPIIQKLLISFLRKNTIQIKTQINDLPNWIRITIPENIQLLLSALQTILQPEIIGFDMDGVLIDTSKSYDKCIIATVKHFTKSKVDNIDIGKLREKGGYNNDWDLTQGLIKQLKFDIPLPSIISTFQSYYQIYKNNETVLLSKNSLFENDKITAIITGRPAAEALAGVKKIHITPDFIISADDVKQQKPSPEGINWLKTTSKKTHMWFCGDTVDDMQAGVASNCVCIGIGKNSANLIQAGADIVLTNINQLEELL